MLKMTRNSQAIVRILSIVMGRSHHDHCAKFSYAAVPSQASHRPEHRIPSCSIPQLLPHRISANTGNEKICQLILIHHIIRTILNYTMEAQPQTKILQVHLVSKTHALARPVDQIDSMNELAGFSF
jgi:hypothetical protein